MIGDGGAVTVGIHQTFQRDPLRRIHLGIVIFESAGKAGAFQHRLARQRRPTRQKKMPRHLLRRFRAPVAVIGKNIIQRQSSAQSQPFADTVIDRHQEGQRAQQMRRDALQIAPFVQALAHQPDFQIAQIAQPAMRQFGIVGGCRGGEIPRLDQRHFQPAHCRVAGGETAGGAAADDQQVEFLVGKSGEGALHAPRLGRTFQESEVLT